MRALYYSQCLGQEKIDRACYMRRDEAAQVYQSVFGQAPSDQQLDSIINTPGASIGGNAFLDMDQNTAANYLRSTPQFQQQQAQTAQSTYQQGINTAVTGLQEQGTSLDTQYKSLLQDVLGQGTVAMNTATTGENNLLAQRGITNNSPLYSQQMTMAQLPVQQANQGAVGSLGYQEGQLQTGLATNIAGIRAGGAGTASQIPLQYGSFALSQAANVANISLANAQAQGAQTGAKYVTTPYGLYDTTTNQYVTGAGTLPSGGQVTQQNGQYFLQVP